MGKILAELKARVIGSPASTLGGALVGAFNLIMHMAAINVDWSQTKQVVITAVVTVVPVITGALLKAAPKTNTVAQDLAQKISQATITAAEQAAASAIEKAIAEVQKFGASPAPDTQEEAKA
jgi:low affinity Fe/Cu permease